ncbi:MAG: hypothetical protein Q8K68_02780 [Nitrospirota bacterium]|nr:hypothetical protein [Nitrospirota bacterium]
MSVVCDGSFNLGFEAEKEKFVVSEGVPEVNIRTSVGRLPENPMGERLFDAGAVWQLYHHNGYYMFSFSSLAFRSNPYKIAIFDQDFSYGEVHIHPDFSGRNQPVDPLWSPLDELLYSNLLARGRGVEVHACGLIDTEGQGHLFIGVSGAGKTTMARLWEDIPGVKILSDDRIILRRKNGKIWMYGTPWHGEGGQSFAGSVPLSRIYFLKKARQNVLAPLKEADTVSRLFTCSFLPFYNREAVDFTLGFLSEIAQEVPCFELSVVPDKNVVKFIKKGLLS